MRSGDWSSDVCSSDLVGEGTGGGRGTGEGTGERTGEGTGGWGDDFQWFSSCIKNTSISSVLLQDFSLFNTNQHQFISVWRSCEQTRFSNIVSLTKPAHNRLTHTCWAINYLFHQKNENHRATITNKLNFKFVVLNFASDLWFNLLFNILRLKLYLHFKQNKFVAARLQVLNVHVGCKLADYGRLQPLEKILICALHNQKKLILYLHNK